MDSQKQGGNADTAPATVPVEAMSFEAAMGELEAIVDKLEKGNVPLEESIAFYERGEALKEHCNALLKNAEMRVEKVRLKADGTPSGGAKATAPLDGAVDDDVPF